MSFTRYYLIFGAILIGIGLAVGLINAFLNLSLGGFSIIIPFLSAMITAQMFVKKERRAPDDTERNRLTVGSFLVLVFFNAIGLLLLFTAPSESEIDLLSSGALTFILIFLAFALGIMFFMMRWAYGGLIRKQAAKIIDDASDTFK